MCCCNMVRALSAQLIQIDSDEILGIRPLLRDRLATYSNSPMIQLTVLIVVMHQKKSPSGVEDQCSSGVCQASEN